jgi:hypothetical protein
MLAERAGVHQTLVSVGVYMQKVLEGTSAVANGAELVMCVVEKCNRASWS